MSKKVTLHIAAFILTLASALHFIRSVAGWEMMIEGWVVPVWVSIILFAAAGYLAIQLWKIAK